MTIALKSVFVAGADKVSAFQCNMTVTGVGMIIAPTPQGRNDNPTYSGQSNAIISGPNCMMIDGDLILTANWNGTGLRVYRIADNGTITFLDNDATGQTYPNSMALDTVRGKVYTGRYATAGIQEYDYSDFQGGGSGSITAGTLWTTGNSNLQFNTSGYPYFCGLYMCGDWIYICRYNNSGAGAYVERWNRETDVAEQIAVIRGAGTIYNGGFTYVAGTNRLYQGGLSGGGGLFVVTDPEAAAATVKAWRVNTAVSGNPSNNYPQLVQDNTDTEHVIVWGHGYRIIKLDIGTCLETEGSSTPSVVWQSATTNTRNSDLALGYHGLNLLDPGVLDIAWIRADRAFLNEGGWINQSNGDVVGSGLYAGSGGFVCGDVLYSSYSSVWKKVTSAGGSPTAYWVWGGYGGDGGAFHVYPAATGPRCNTSWEVVFGTYTMTYDPNVKSAVLTVPGYQVPSGCSLSFYLSNDNGANYQAVTPGTLTDFATTGYQVRIKIVGAGTQSKGSYVKGGGISLTMCDQVIAYSRSRLLSMKISGVTP